MLVEGSVAQLENDILATRRAGLERSLAVVRDTSDVLDRNIASLLKENKELHRRLSPEDKKLAPPRTAPAPRQEMEDQRDAESEAIESLEARLAEANHTMAEKRRLYAAASKENKKLHQLLLRANNR